MAVVATFLDNQAHELLRYSSRFGQQFQTDEVSVWKEHDGSCVAGVETVMGVGVCVGSTSAGTDIHESVPQPQMGASRKIRRIRGNDDAINNDDEERAATATDSGNIGDSSATRTHLMAVDQADSDNITDNDEIQSPFFSFAMFVAQVAKGGGRQMDDITVEREAESLLEQYLQVTNNTTTLP